MADLFPDIRWLNKPRRELMDWLSGFLQPECTSERPNTFPQEARCCMGFCIASIVARPAGVKSMIRGRIGQVPLEGLEPPTLSLGRNCSSIELQRQRRKSSEHRMSPVVITLSP